MKNWTINFQDRGVTKKVNCFTTPLLILFVFFGTAAIGLIVWRMVMDISNGFNYGFLLFAFMPYAFFIYGTFWPRRNLSEIINSKFRPVTKQDEERFRISLDYYKIKVPADYVYDSFETINKRRKENKKNPEI